MNDSSFVFWLNIIANLLQIQNYELLLKDKSNNELIQELQKQDKILENQNREYLEKIIKQNDEILKYLTNKK